MIQITAPKNDLTKHYLVAKNFAAVIYVSPTGLIVDIDGSKIKKYKTFIMVKYQNINDSTHDPSDVKDMIGYKEALTDEQREEQFDILSKDAKTTKKTNSMHS